MSNTDMDYCNQCPNHCPVTALKCGRGKKYFAQISGQAPEEDQKHREVKVNHHEWRERGHEEHGHEEHGYEEHGNHHKRIYRHKHRKIKTF